MAKEELVKLSGTVIECLPKAMFRVQLESGHIILGIVSGKIRKNNINILLGDTVDVEMSGYDITKGRITYRYK